MRRRSFLPACASLLVAGCATLPGMDPLRVQLIALEPFASNGLEQLFVCKLRIQNPNDRNFDYRGVSVEIQLQGNTLASGVSDASGTLPAFGETVLVLPVSLSAASVARAILDLVLSNRPPRIEYALRGKLGMTFGSIPFESRGAVDLPQGERT